MHLRDLLREAKFAGDLEREYCLNFVRRSETNSSNWWFFLSSIYWPLVTLIGYFVSLDPMAMTVLAAGGGTMLVINVVTVTAVKRLKARRIVQLVGFFLANSLMLTIAMIDKSDGIANPVVPMIWILGSTAGLGLLAFRNHVHHVASTFFLVTFAIGVNGYPLPFFTWFFGLTMTLMSSNAQIFMHRVFKLGAIESFRQQSIYTPKQVLVSAIKSDRNVSEVFQPAPRECVCICSDWRQFQNFAGNVTPETLAKVLEAYYDEQSCLLDRAFPFGNYFMDWIADELFAVGFVTEECTLGQVAQNAVNYASSALASRVAFAALHGAPVGLDIGLSIGTATIGMLGPHGNRKATALGRTPGLARRLQTLGKQLRPTHGDQDRIIMHPDLARYIDTAANLAFKIDLSEEPRVKDLDTDSVWVAEDTQKKAA